MWFGWWGTSPTRGIADISMRAAIFLNIWGFLWIFPDQNIFYISYVFYTIPNTQSTFDLIRAADCVSTQRAASESTLIQLNIMRRKGADLTLLKYSSSWKYWFNQISPKYEYLQELTQIGQCLPKYICTHWTAGLRVVAGVKRVGAGLPVVEIQL